MTGISQLKPGAQALGFLIEADGSNREFLTAMVPQPEEKEMDWKTPKIVEVPVGMEINMYACAARR